MKNKRITTIILALLMTVNYLASCSCNNVDTTETTVETTIETSESTEETTEATENTSEETTEATETTASETTESSETSETTVETTETTTVETTEEVVETTKETKKTTPTPTKKPAKATATPTPKETKKATPTPTKSGSKATPTPKPTATPTLKATATPKPTSKPTATSKCPYPNAEVGSYKNADWAWKQGIKNDGISKYTVSFHGENITVYGKFDKTENDALKKYIKDLSPNVAWTDKGMSTAKNNAIRTAYGHKILLHSYHHCTSGWVAECCAGGGKAKKIFNAWMDSSSHAKILKKAAGSCGVAIFDIYDYNPETNKWECVGGASVFNGVEDSSFKPTATPTPKPTSTPKPTNTPTPKPTEQTEAPADNGGEE